MTKDLNRLSAEVIMGYSYVGTDDHGKVIVKSGDKELPFVFDPLTDMNQCMGMVVEKMHAFELYLILDCWPNNYGAVFVKERNGIISTVAGGKGKVLNEAILTAALKAKSVEVE